VPEKFYFACTSVDGAGSFCSCAGIRIAVYWHGMEADNDPMLPEEPAVTVLIAALTRWWKTLDAYKAECLRHRMDDVAGNAWNCEVSTMPIKGKSGMPYRFSLKKCRRSGLLVECRS